MSLLAFQALAGRPIASFGDSLRNWCFAAALNGGYRDHHEHFDDLLHFKRGFSRSFHDFVVWQWVLMPDAYHRLCAASSQAEDSDFFPAYRCIAVGDQSAATV